MEIKNQTYQPENLCNLIFSLSLTNPASQPIRACSRDYGFDFDEEDLGRELLAPLPISRTNQGTLNIDTGEFESLFFWFAS